MIDVDFYDLVASLGDDDSAHTVENKEAMRQELARMTEDFLRLGGQIRVIPIGVGADLESDFNRSIQSAKVTGQTRRGLRGV